MLSYSHTVSSKLSIPEKQVSAVLELLEAGSTIPFIARYRKDKTGALDELQIQQIQEEAKLQQDFADRKAFIEKTITEQGKMTGELQLKIDSSATLNELEDIYLPYKPKRKTRAQAARELGLEPLALLLMEQQATAPEDEAASFLSDTIKTIEEALQGARDIIAEMMNEDADVRSRLRTLFEQTALVQSKVVTGKEEEAVKFKDYFDFAEPISKIPSHRFLAIMRGVMEGYLRMSILPDEEQALLQLAQQYVTADNAAADQVTLAAKDSYRRLLQPSLESEFRMAIKQRSDEEAINVFAENLRQLLLSSPLGNKRVLAIDPGYRSGCKVVALDENGNLQETTVIYVHEKNFRLTDAEQKVRGLLAKYNTEAFAVGDGTAGRETEQFIKGLQTGLPVFLVNEDGASIYSASEIGREEFPDQDVTVRGAVSIGRRLIDPLAELVKIDPKSIGVGQYQHDVSQSRLREKLDQTVVSCVNAVGVNLNTAGKYLLGYVSGIGPSLAENIVRYRKENGRFKNRKQLLEVPRLGQKAFEQCAGFLRVTHGDHPLDASGVHPESYPIVEKMAADVGVPIEDMLRNQSVTKKISPHSYVDEETGLHTLRDILKELEKPGLDPRQEARAFEFAEIYSIDDVHAGMIIPGQVTNLTRFGAFVDIGVKQDGLVHVSEIAHKYISDPAEALKLNEKVMVKVLEVDIARKRISLSIKQTVEPPASNRRREKGAQAARAHSLDDALNQLKRKFGK